MATFARSKTFKAMNWFPLFGYVVAFGLDFWAFVLGAVLTTHSVVGGIAVMFVALILAGGISWRISFKWKQLHSSEQ